MKRTKFSMSVISLIGVLIIGLVSVGFAQNGLALFEKAEMAIADADSMNAAVLSPESFAKAKDLFDEARKKETLKKSSKDIDELLNASYTLAKKAYETANVAKLVLKEVIPARSRAIMVDAPSAAKREWEEANNLWRKAVSQIEDNSLDAARKQQKEMIDKFQRAESEAIRNTVLKAAREAIETARKAGADEIAPLTFRSASDALNIAENELKQNTSVSERAKSSARFATMEGKHALRITETAKRFEREKAGWEKAFLGYEEHFSGIARRLQLDIDWSDGADGAGAQLLHATDSLRLSAESQLSLKEQQYSFLEQNYIQTRNRLEQELAQAQLRVAELEGKLGVVEKESEALKRAQQLEEKAKRIGGAFTAKEAQSVVVQKGTILLRLTGISFPSGTATVNQSMQKFLNRVVQAVQEVSSATFVVEGHTDALGDNDTNKELSEQRAAAVASYLRTNLALPASRINSVGRGEDQPIADNNTREGRAQNRRIDILIQTK
ncbi:MAG: OmpA family protein [bacterium]|nr:OmpA family protein [bacterium]